MKPYVRAGLVLSLAAVALLVVTDLGLGQSRIGGRGGVTGNFTGRPGGITGNMPGGITGRPGGISGGITGGITGGVTGGITGGVTGGITGGVTGGMPRGGIPTPGLMEKTWHCPRCNREVGRGVTAPANVTCCGQTYINGKSLGFGTPGAPNPAFGGAAPVPVVPTQPFNPAPSPWTTPAPASTTSYGSVTLIVLGSGAVLLGLVILGGVGILIVQSLRSSAPAPRRRRLRRDDDCL